MKASQIFSLFRDRLTKISEKESLSWFSLFLVILFDIFLFSLVASGLSDATKNIASPGAYLGYSCMSLIDTDAIKNEDEKKLAVVQKIDNYYDYSYGKSSYDYTASSGYSYDASGYGVGCEEIRKAISDIYSAQGTQSSFSRKIDELNAIEKLISSNATEQSAIRSKYDTKLLEQMANQGENARLDPGTASGLALTMNNLRESSWALALKKTAIVNEIYALPEVQKVTGLMESSATRLRTTYASLSFWYPVKTFGMELVFLLPLFAITFLWVHRSVRRGREVQALVGSHVLAVLSLFALAKLMEFVYDILPHKLIQDVINFLEEWNIIEIWYYLLILLAIGGCLLAIYIVQKKILHPRRQEMKRVAHGLCFRCGTRRTGEEEYCVSCGNHLFTACKSCKGKTYTGGEHCIKCGEIMDAPSEK